MKSSSSILCLALAVLTFSPWANAQSPFVGGYNGGGQLYEPGAFRAVEGAIRTNTGWPGSVWVSANYADRGLGFRGSYLTAGMKTRLFEDALDGRWLLEVRGHISEEGGYFGNFGIERVFTVQAANADVSLAAWFDYDDDQDAFAVADTLESWGVTAKIKTRHWDLIANGYFPIGTSDMSQGTEGNPFFENSLILVPGIDSGLEGFDVTVRTRPSKLAFVNGTFDFGGYGYNSDLVEFFGGGRARLSMQLFRGMIISGEFNFDDRFDATGLLGVTLLYGGNPRGNEYSPVGKDLERTVRNDHIVRFNQDVIPAIDPDTGLAYNVIHVDNTAGPGGTGTFEDPFGTLAEAEAAGATDDIIYVASGDGTVTGYADGIALQDGQKLLGEGVEHAIPIANGPEFGDVFLVETGTPGVRPVITGSNNGSAVEVASRNTIRGFEIDGTQAVGGMANGISGSLLVTNTDGIIEDVMIRSAIISGINITNLAGDWTFARNDIQDNGFSGISLVDACDPTSVFNFDSNIASNNLVANGIEIINYDTMEINFTNNITDGNGGDGILLQGFKGDDAIGSQIVIDNHLARSNLGIGISVVDGAGNLTISNSVIGTEIDDDLLILGGPITGNEGGGVNIVDFVTEGDDMVLLSGNDINTNGAGIGAGVNIELNEGTTRALLTGNEIDANAIGLNVSADTTTPNATFVDINLIDNVSLGLVAGNALQGIRFVTDGRATASLNVDQTDGNLPIFFNGFNGIDLLAEGESSLQALIRNVSISGSGNAGVFGQVTEDGQLSVLVEDSIVGPDLAQGVNASNGTGFIFSFDNDEGGQINTIVIRDVVANDNFFGGFSLISAPGTLTDVAIIDSTFAHPFLQGALSDGIFDFNNQVDGAPFGFAGNAPDTGFGIGISIMATGDDDQMLNPQIDNRTRLFMEGTTVDRFTLAGLDINANGDASVLADIVGNTITNNGIGFEDMIGQPGPPFFDGISLETSERATINANVLGNLVLGNFDDEFSAVTNDTSSITALLDSNNMLGTGVVGVNDVGSTMALAFTNNAILGDVFVNVAGIGDFTLEVDGFTNGIGFANPFPANITDTLFGTIVEPANDAAEAAFLLDGFPPSPTPFP